jgi:hypothetical protein
MSVKNIEYFKYLKYKKKYLLLKNMIGGNHIEEAKKLMLANYKFIFDMMFKERKELGGIITNDMKFVYIGPGTDIMVEPERNECYAPWHSHPPIHILTLPVENIVFLPPSSSDIYYAILGKILKKYNHSITVSKEGIYIVTPTETSRCLSEYELKELLKSEDPWRMPGEPIANERGLEKVDFHGNERYFPYLYKLLSMEIDWDHHTIDAAVAKYIEQMKELYIDVEFIPIKRY